MDPLLSPIAPTILYLYKTPPLLSMEITIITTKHEGKAARRAYGADLGIAGKLSQLVATAASVPAELSTPFQRALGHCWPRPRVGPWQKPLGELLAALQVEGTMLLRHIYVFPAPPNGASQCLVCVFELMDQPYGTVWTDEDLAFAVIAHVKPRGRPSPLAVVQCLSDSGSPAAATLPPWPVLDGDLVSLRSLAWIGAGAYRDATPTHVIGQASILGHVTTAGNVVL